MTVTLIENYITGKWMAGASPAKDVFSAVDGSVVAQSSTEGIDFEAVLDHARNVGGPALRKMTFSERAAMLKALGAAIMERKEELYEINSWTGATRRDGWIDIEGGAGTLFSMASKGKIELPEGNMIVDGPVERLSREGTFVGQHVYTPLQGTAIHINAFNFPVWGMLEKLGPTLLAGMPAIVKPATPTAYLAEKAVRIMLETELLPEGAVQLIAGSAGNLLDHVTGQDVIAFTGSASTAAKLKTHPRVIAEGTRFVAEQDSLNSCILGPDAAPDGPEFDLFVKEVVREMTVKAGQKCTAIRRSFVPASLLDEAQTAIIAALAKVQVGNPSVKETRMGALVSLAQRDDVREKVKLLMLDAEMVHGSLDAVDGLGADLGKGAFMSPILLRCEKPAAAKYIHDVEAFGPVSTVMPYDTLESAIEYCKLGKGSLVMSVFTASNEVAADVVMNAGAFHGRIAFINRDNAAESTGHGSPLPVLVHGGPGRAGGGEELGGIRSVKHYMQRTAIQATPGMLSGVTRTWQPGAPINSSAPHPFRLKFGELEIGKTVETEARTITLEDIEHFAHFTGDTFYAHMDEEAAKANPFFPGRVAHGYLILSFAAGLFVSPEPGPVLANYGLEGLRFEKPVSPGDQIKVRLTAKSKKSRNAEYGEVEWDVLVTNQEDAPVARYTLLTMNAR